MENGTAVRFEIESGVPLPEIIRRGGTGREPLYPFAKLDVNQSFLVPFAGDDPKTVARRVSAAITVHRRKPEYAERAYHTRVTKDGVRVWRAADGSGRRRKAN